MATEGGQVILRGRFPAGARVRLVKVRDESVLRAGSGREVATARVDENGEVRFSKGVEVGGRYFIVGRIDGQPVEVRVRGNKPGEESPVLTNAPVQPDRVRLSDGSWADEAPEHKPAAGEAVPALGQHQVPEGTVQRSDTPRGTAHPVDPGESLPYPKQEDVDEGVVQRSSTATGMATPIPPAHAERQEDSEGMLQRSDTPHGVTTPIPAGDPVRIQHDKESADTKAARGEPVKAAARPVAHATGKAPARKAPAKKKASTAKSRRSTTTKKGK